MLFTLLLGQPTLASLNRWEDLPCPSSNEIQHLKSTVHWNDNTAYTCDLTPSGKLGRLLLLLSKMQLPQNEHLGSIGENLKNPMEFLATRTAELIIDIKKPTIAFNLAYKKEIHLGAFFFARSPLESLSALIHEARHSDVEEAEGHDQCIQGDIPRTLGGCDGVFSTEKTAGAYSYEVFFDLALARSDLVSQEDREYLENAANLLLLRRFNYLQPQLAYFQDVLVGLDTNNHLRVLHPFADSTVAPLGLDRNVKIKNIGHDDRFGGIFLLQEKGKARTWNWGTTAQSYYLSAVAETEQMLFAGKARLPNDNYAYSLFLDQNRRLRYMDFNENLESYKAYDYPVQPPFQTQSFFIGAQDRNYFLTQEGRLFQFENSKFVSLLDSTQTFRHASGGILHDAVHLVGADGILYQIESPSEDVATTDSSPVGDALSNLKRSEFQSGIPAKMYLEGTQVRALLDEKGAVWIGHHGRKKRGILLSVSEKFSSLSTLKLVASSHPLMKPREEASLDPFQKKCGVTNTIREPWFHRGVGLKDGNLIFEGDENSCLPAALPVAARGQVASFRFLAKFGGTEARQNIYFNEVALEIMLNNGQTLRILPYER